MDKNGMIIEEYARSPSREHSHRILNDVKLCIRNFYKSAPKTEINLSAKLR